ncbi:hypothetical protein CRE_20890 [Caenorhabditis remanei]|uniref:Uncharacterized protein n=1 Tax=Caenorhabditis remanei TaxID=31234 RepID=E3MV52_CAERE|nr:hypothetical protein CRE_20890 [Caenorhabditis remanei]
MPTTLEVINIFFIILTFPIGATGVEQTVLAQNMAGLNIQALHTLLSRYYNQFPLQPVAPPPASSAPYMLPAMNMNNFNLHVAPLIAPTPQPFNPQYNFIPTNVATMNNEEVRVEIPLPVAMRYNSFLFFTTQNCSGSTRKTSAMEKVSIPAKREKNIGERKTGYVYSILVIN